MAILGAWPQPKIQPTLLLLLVAAACVQMSPKGKEMASPGTSEESRHISTGPETASPPAKLASNSTKPPAELASNSAEPSAKLARNPPTTAQQEPTTAQTLAMKDSAGSVSPSGLPSTEAIVALSSGLAGVTAAGHEQPVTDLKQEGLKQQVGTVAGSPGRGQETQTVPGMGRQSTSAPMEPAKGTDRSGHSQTVPASTNQTSRYRATPDHATGPRENQPTPTLSPPALSPTPHAKKQKPNSEVFTPIPASSPSPVTRKLPVGIIVVLVIVAIMLLVLLAMALYCRSQRRSGSTSFSRPGEWAGPVSLPEEKGEGQAGAGGQQAGPGESRRPTLTTFFGKRHSRVSSVAMEDVAGAKGEGLLSEPLLAPGEQGGSRASSGPWAAPAPAAGRPE
uniref:Leukosialin n=1 Tax=Chelonoidis abingdonii TaxID=106734 RepID=A0A8C0H3W9_CHEAB